MPHILGVKSYIKEVRGMKMMVWKAPAFLAPLLRRLFTGRKNRRTDQRKP